MADGKRPFSFTRSDGIEGSFTESEFFDYVGTKLRRSGSSSPKKFIVFRHEEDDELDYNFVGRFSPSRPGVDIFTMRDQIRKALELVDFGCSLSILAQFWALDTIGGRQLLKTSDQPFGMTSLEKALCYCRKLSSDFQFACDDGDKGRSRRKRLAVGPPSRVFVSGLPEYSPDVELYSDTEYPMRRQSLQLKLKNYMAVPVFEDIIISQKCVGVIELISTTASRHKGEIDNPAYIFGLLSTALQGVGLRTSAFTSHFEMETNLSSTERSNALHNIGTALKEMCMKHNLPFAQTWTNIEFKGCSPLVLSTTCDEYYQSHFSFSTFRDICESFHLSRGRGVVWKAFDSGGLCFCADVGQLSIADYSFSHVARKVMLNASFAICLKSHGYDTGNSDPDVYVVELFLPSTAAANPPEFLQLVLLTMKKHLSGFSIGSEQNSESGIYVQVLRVSDEYDKQEFIRLFPDNNSGDLVGGLDQSSPMSTEQQPILYLQSGSASSSVCDTAGYVGSWIPFHSWHGCQGSLKSFMSLNRCEGNLQSFHSWDGASGLFHHQGSISSTSFSFNEDLSPDTTISMRDAGSFDQHKNSSASTSLILPDQDEVNRTEEDQDDNRMVRSFDSNNESPGSSNLEGVFQQRASISTSSALKEDHFGTLSMSTGAENVHHNFDSYALTSQFPDNKDVTGWMMRGFESSQNKKVKNSASLTQQISLEAVQRFRHYTLKEAALYFKVHPSTLKRKCRALGIESWRDNDKCKGGPCSTSSTGSGKHNEMNERNYGSAVSAENNTTSTKNQASAAALPNNSLITIKAQCGEKMIKFRLPFSSQLVHMESEVASRLKLEAGSFKIWYLDEDNDFILLTCDSDMQTMVESMGKSTTVRVYATFGDSVPEQKG